MHGDFVPKNILWKGGKRNFAVVAVVRTYLRQVIEIDSSSDKWCGRYLLLVCEENAQTHNPSLIIRQILVEGYSTKTGGV